jgi:hypothetical protein
LNGSEVGRKTSSPCSYNTTREAYLVFIALNLSPYRIVNTCQLCITSSRCPWDVQAFSSSLNQYGGAFFLLLCFYPTQPLAYLSYSFCLLSFFFIMLLFEGFLLCGMNGFGVCVVVLYQQWMGLGFIISYFLFCITTQQERPIAALSSDPVDLFWSPLSTNRYHRNLPHQVIIVNLAWESWTRKKGSFGGEIRKKKERREERRKKKIKKSSIKRNFVSITPDV